MIPGPCFSPKQRVGYAAQGRHGTMDDKLRKIVRKEGMGDICGDVVAKVHGQAAEEERVRLTNALTEEERDNGVFYILEGPSPPLNELLNDTNPGPRKKHPREFRR